VSGLILFAILGLGVEQLLDHRERKKWKQVAALACHTLGDSGSRPIVSELSAVYLGPHDNLAQFKPLSDQTYRMHPLASAAPVDAAATLSVFSSCSLPPLEFADDSLVPEARLRVLLQDLDWLEFAVGRFQPLRHEIRVLLAPWAPIMILSHEPRALLNSLAHLNDEFGYFRVDLERLAQLVRGGASKTEIGPPIDAAVRRWQLVDARARILTNALWRTAGAGAWSYALPGDLLDVDLDTAFRDKDRIAGWTPPFLATA
jgi:hypothetical protein